MTMPALRMPTPREGSTGDPLPTPHPTWTAEAADAAIRQHELERAIDTPTTESGVSVMLEHDNVRCVLVVSPRVPRHALSPRELQIARRVADGATNRAIASSLDISLWTVSTHMRRIFAKLGVSSRAEMVAQFFGGGDSGQLR